MMSSWFGFYVTQMKTAVNESFIQRLSAGQHQQSPLTENARLETKLFLLIARRALCFSRGRRINQLYYDVIKDVLQTTSGRKCKQEAVQTQFFKPKISANIKQLFQVIKVLVSRPWCGNLFTTVLKTNICQQQEQIFLRRQST